jgi:hypothetical protein
MEISMSDLNVQLEPPDFRIEHRRSDVAPGIVGVADDPDSALDLVHEIRRQLLAAGADGILAIIDQRDDPEKVVSTHKVDNRVPPRSVQGS